MRILSSLPHLALAAGLLVLAAGVLLLLRPALAADMGRARAAESSGPATSGSALAGVQPGVVDGAAARRLVGAGVKVVDVRTRGEFEAGHLPGAVLIPFDEIGGRAAEVGPPSTPVLVYCRSGRRSAIAAEALRDRGFTRVFDLQAYDRWARSAP